MILFCLLTFALRRASDAEDGNEEFVAVLDLFSEYFGITSACFMFF